MNAKLSEKRFRQQVIEELKRRNVDGRPHRVGGTSPPPAGCRNAPRSWREPGLSRRRLRYQVGKANGGAEEKARRSTPVTPGGQGG